MFRRSSVLIKKYVRSAVAETNQAKSIKSRMYNVPDTREDYQVYILRLAYPMWEGSLFFTYEHYC